MVIAAMGPLAGFAVAIAAVAFGLHVSSYGVAPVLHRVQAPLLISLSHALGRSAAQPLQLLLPHPILSAAWIGILITALNLIPAGQLDGGHMVYALSPALHRFTSRASTAVLLLLGIFSWAGWILWAVILLTPGMRHPKVPGEAPRSSAMAFCACACLRGDPAAGSATYQPFQGYSLMAHPASSDFPITITSSPTKRRMTCHLPNQRSRLRQRRVS